MNVTAIRELASSILPWLIMLAYVLYALSCINVKMSAEKYNNLVMNKGKPHHKKQKIVSVIRSISLWQNYEKQLIDVCKKSNGKHEIQEFYDYYKKIFLYAMSTSFVISILAKNFFFATVGLVISIVVCHLKLVSLTNERKKIVKGIDDKLPTFIMNISMSMEAGINMQNAVASALQNIDKHDIIYDDFERILSDTKTYPDNVAKVYNNFADRVDSPNVQIFCNTVISSLRNGTDMKVILSREADRLKKLKKEQAQMDCNKAEQHSTLMATGMVLFPGIILLVAPFLLNS